MDHELALVFFGILVVVLTTEMVRSVRHALRVFSSGAWTRVDAQVIAYEPYAYLWSDDNSDSVHETERFAVKVLFKAATCNGEFLTEAHLQDFFRPDEAAAAAKARFPMGAVVAVRCDPQEPETAYLTTASEARERLAVVARCLATGVGLMLWIVLLAYWVDTTR